MEVELTGSGGIGTSKPGAAKMTEQLFAASSSDSKATAHEVDPRPRTQRTTGTKKTNNKVMNSTNKEEKSTGAGELGGPRPGAEGIIRVPSASSSNDRGEKQVEVQACSHTYATGPSKQLGGADESEI